MKPAVIHLQIEQGAKFHKTLYYKPNNVAADLTGYTALMQIRDAVGGEILSEFTTDDNSIVITAEEGKIELIKTTAETSAMTFTSGVYDISLIDADGEALRLARGAVSVGQAITVPA